MKSIKIPFNFSGGKVTTTSSPVTVAEQKIINVATTSKYERVMRHRYGAGIRQLLFEPLDELAISDFVIDAKQEMSNNISRVSILDIKLSPSKSIAAFGNQDTTLGITIVYRLPLGAPQVVAFNIAVPGVTAEDSPI